MIQSKYLLLQDWLSGRRKSIRSEYIRKVCTKSNRKEKEKALKNGNFAQANLAAVRENACRNIENRLEHALYSQLHVLIVL
jgi:hypothetical protein